MLLRFSRGDSYERGFVLKDKATQQVITDTFDEVYFTVKRNWRDADYQFQKRMTTGGITSDGDGHYTLYIQPEDTNNLAFGDYDCDFEFKRNDGYKKTFPGRLTLDKEVTYQGNE